jgi:CDP-diacylglycerol--glycerol-3-phosphate 3-phosphatidyltransferase
LSRAKKILGTVSGAAPRERKLGRTRRRPRLEGFKREILNLPNMITIGRILMIPPILMLVDKTDPFKGVLAMALFLIAGGLDVLDGWLARRRGLVTFFGKFADPLADKIMVMALLVYLCAENRVPPWLVAILLGREFYISGLRTIAINEGVEIGAGAGGKAKTSFQVIGIACVLIYFPYRAPWGGWLRFYDIGLLLLYVSAVLSVWSAVTYTRGFIDALAAKTEEVSVDDDDPDGGQADG